nr:hypothetical protein BaRGS_008931 [Batillaria attramentaria]
MLTWHAIHDGSLFFKNKVLSDFLLSRIVLSRIFFQNEILSVIGLIFVAHYYYYYYCYYYYDYYCYCCCYHCGYYYIHNNRYQ